MQLIQDDKELAGPQKETLEDSVSTIRRQRNWYRMDLGFRIFEWYQHTIGFSHPEKVRELDLRIKAANQTRHSDALTRDSLIFSDLMNGHRTAQEIAFAHYVREEYVHESLRYHAARGRVMKCGKSLRRKKAAAQWALTEGGMNWLHTLTMINSDRRKSFMREMLAGRDYTRYRFLKSVELMAE